MAEFIEIIKKILNYKTRYHKPLKNIIKSYSTQSKIGQNALIQNKVFEQAINLMGDTIEVLDIEIEQKDNRIEFLSNKIGLPDSKVIEETNRLGLRKMSSKRKSSMILDTLNYSLNNHKNRNKT